MNLRIPNAVAYASAFLFVVLLLLAFAFGVAVQRYRLPPFTLVEQVETAVRKMADTTLGTRPWYYRESGQTEVVRRHGTLANPGALNLVTAVGEDEEPVVEIVDMQGEVLHRWTADWFETWPEPQHLLPRELPRSRPGTHIHGIWLFEDGDVVYNYEKLGMVRRSLCGDVRWRLPYRTHHSVFVDDAGFIWAAGQSDDFGARPDYPAHKAPVREPEVLKISQDGEILRKISVFDLLRDNGYEALLYMRASSISNQVTGDSLHLNDVEVFPEDLAPGVFAPGDVLLSLRNVHTILVFDPRDLRIKYLHTGGFVRQHDPDFIDGNTIAVFDNNFVAPRGHGQSSRILLLDARTGELETWYEGSAEHPFFTSIMGKHQWLPNGHVIVSDSVNGRGFELNANAELLWEYFNLTAPGEVGIVEEVQRLPARFRAVFEGADCA